MKRNTRLSPVLIIVTSVLASCSGSGANEEPVATEVNVQVGKVSRALLHEYVEAYGSVEPQRAGNGESAAAARLAAPSAGVVMAVPAQEGARVAAGTVIVKLDDRAALAGVEQAEHTLAYATQLVERQDKLRAIEGTSEKAIQEAAQQLAVAKAGLAAARAQLALVHLATPVAGTVAHINVQLGSAVDINTIVAEVVDLDHLEVTASVSAAEAMALKAGQTVEVFADMGNPVTSSARVSFVSPAVDSMTGSVLVRIALPMGANVRPGQLVRTRIVSTEHTALAVPASSVVTDTEGRSVVARVEGGQARQQSVKIGVRDGNLIEVSSEQLKEGDTVVTTGAYGLPPETRIRVLNP